MDNAQEGGDDIIVAAMDRENFRRQLTRAKTVRAHFLLDWLIVICHIQKITPLPKGKTEPNRLKIPVAWRKYADDEPFIIFDSGRTRDVDHPNRPTERVIIMSSPFLMEVSYFNA